MSLKWLWQAEWLLALGVILVLIDTGGLHWLVGSMLYYGVLKRSAHPSKAQPPSPDEALRDDR